MDELDDYSFREKVRETWRDALVWNNAEIPRDLLVCKRGNVAVLTMDTRRIMGLPDGIEAPYRAGDMRACFDVYAAALRAYVLKRSDRVCLNIPRDQLPPVDISLFTEYVGYSRFLYRCLRFSEQHADWFVISEPLQEHVDAFRRWMRANSFETCVGEARVRKGGESGPPAMRRFAEDWAGTLRLRLGYPPRGLGGNYLPVSLRVEGEKDGPGSRVFAKGMWGPDVWQYSGHKLAIFQVRAAIAKRSPVVLSELFLVANLVQDVYGGRFSNIHLNGKLPPDSPYRAIRIRNGLYAALLLEEGARHPLITWDTIAEYGFTTLETGIAYDILEYIVQGQGDREVPMISRLKR